MKRQHASLLELIWETEKSLHTGRDLMNRTAALLTKRAEMRRTSRQVMSEFMRLARRFTEETDRRGRRGD
jgi:hypothetical protein